MKYKNHSKKYVAIFCLIFAFIFSRNVIAQSQPTLTFFSEDGIRFWVSINGEKQNNTASSNVKIPVTQEAILKAKIIFENESLPEISKNVMTTPLGDVVYRIKKVRKKYVVRLYSAPQNFVQNDTEKIDNEITPSKVNVTPCYDPMPTGSFLKAVTIIQKETFETTKLSTSKQVVDNNCLLVEQIKSLLKTYDYETSRLEFAKYAYKRCFDPENYYLLNDAFEYDSSKTELADFVKRK